MRAYVLISTETGRVNDLVQSLRKLPGVQAADVVAGPYDIVAVLEQTDTRDLGHVVMNDIHGLPGLKHTTTLVAIG